MSGQFEIIIKDGNRIVSWEFQPDTPLSDVLRAWEKGYIPYDKVWLNGAEVPEAAYGCFLSAFTEGRKVWIIVRSHRKEKS